MRKKLIAGNWKMNQTVTEAGHYFEKFKVKAREDVDLVFIPPFTDIPVAKFFISRSSIGLGAQNMYPCLLYTSDAADD